MPTTEELQQSRLELRALLKAAVADLEAIEHAGDLAGAPQFSEATVKRLTTLRRHRLERTEKRLAYVVIAIERNPTLGALCRDWALLDAPEQRRLVKLIDELLNTIDRPFGRKELP